MEEDNEIKRSNRFDRLVRREFWISKKGNLFLKSKYANIEKEKYPGILPLPLDEYPYKIISLPTIVDRAVIKERIGETTWKGKKVKDYWKELNKH